MMPEGMGVGAGADNLDGLDPARLVGTLEGMGVGGGADRGARRRTPRARRWSRNACPIGARL